MKYYGQIGYAVTEETAPSVWEDKIVERAYKGDIQRLSSSWQNAEKVNKDLNLNNSISIVADPYAFEHFHTIKYATWLGTRWCVTNVEVKYPRLLLTVGGIYNGPTVDA